MLNELYQVYQSIKKHGLSMPDAWHKNMMGPPKHDAHIVIFLDASGVITDTQFGTGSYAHWNDSKTMRAFGLAVCGTKAGARFPAFVPQYKTKVNVPREIKEKCKNKELSKAECEKETGEARVRAFVQVFSQKMGVLTGELLPVLRDKLCLDSNGNETPPVIAELIRSLDSIDATNLAQDLLKSHKDVDGLIRKNKLILIVFELHSPHGSAENTEQYKYPVNHVKTIQKLNKLLIVQDSGKVSEKIPHKDIFGFPAISCQDGFKPIKIRSFSDIYPRSLNKNVPSFTRWGQQSNELCVVGENSRNKVVGALEWITSPTFEEKTWRSLQRITGKKELLVAFSELPESGDEGVGLLDIVLPKTDAVFEGSYTGSASRLIKIMDGYTTEAKLANMMYFSIRNTSNNTAGIHNYGNYTVESLVTHANEWESACKNLPYLNFFESGKAVKLQSPYPAEIVPLVNRSSKDTSAKKEPRLFELEDAFYLFAGHSNQQEAVAERLIRLLIDRPFRLVLRRASYYRVWFPSTDRAHENPSKDIRKFMLRLPVLLAIGLYKTNIRKEEYMVNVAFLIGQYLALLDEAHLIHYQVHNKGKTPNTLIGSRAMSTALDNPTQALNSSGQRAIIYIEWIKTKATQANSDGARLSNLRFRIEKNAQKIGQLELPDMFNETEKAQLILGYLSGSPNNTEEKE